MSYHWHHATGAHGIQHTHAHHAPHALKVRILPSLQEDLITHEVGAVVRHKAPIFHPARVAAVQVHVDVRAVAAAVIGPALEVPVLIENDLK